MPVLDDVLLPALLLVLVFWPSMPIYVYIIYVINPNVTRNLNCDWSIQSDHSFIHSFIQIEGGGANIQKSINCGGNNSICILLQKIYLILLIRWIFVGE